jgi:Rrf2 family protein
MLSKTSNYGIKAILFIAHKSQQGKRVRVPEIAEGIDAPQHFTGKIIQQLAKAKILNSEKGPHGGFEMSERNRKKYNIRTIVEVLDGDALYTECGLGLKKCNSSRPCPIHEEYSFVRDQVIHLHTSTSIDDLAIKLNDLAVLK